MKEKHRIFLLAVIMAIACVAVTGSTIAVLYNTALHEQREVLVAIAKSQARLIEAIAEFNATIPGDNPEETTLEQLTEAHRHFKGIGETGEFTVAKREGDNIVFLLSHRYYDFNNPKPVPWDSDLAEPMRLALSGLSGSVIGMDYRGRKVLAAYEPLGNLKWGIVAKVDLAELGGPFVKASVIALLVAALVIVVGISLFRTITAPIMEHLREHSRNLAKMVESLRESEDLLQKSHDELETRVQERTEDLVKANEKLGLEIRERTLAEERLKELWKIAEMVNLEYRELCDHILQGSLKMTRSRFAFYGFLNHDETRMLIYSWSREVAEQCRVREQQIDYPIDCAGIWADAVRERKVLIVNDYTAAHPGKTGLPEGHVPLTRILVVPVFKRNRIVSLLAVANKPEDYDEEDVKQLSSYVTGVQDILDHRKTESELKESEKKYGALVENSLTGIYIVQDSRIVFANRRFAEMHGYSVPEVIGRDSLDFIHTDDRDYLKEKYKNLLKEPGVAQSFEVKEIGKSGELLWGKRSNTVIEYKGAPAILGNVNDITEMKEVEEQLRASETECRVLSRQIIEAEEKEKKRIARELHDGIGQSLAAIKYRMESFYLTAKQEAYSKADELRAVVQMIQDTMEEMRRVHNYLHPVHIEELGLVKTITYFCDEFQATYSAIQVESSIELTESDMPDYMKAPLFRIYQEAMNNAAQHSNAARIECRLWRSRNKIKLTIQDDGVGFDPRNRDSVHFKDKGVGLYSMKERAELSGGKLEIESSPGDGTVIHASWYF